MAAGCQARVRTVEAFPTELQGVFADLVLPRLNLRDLVCVSCSCQALRDAAYLRDEPWRCAASEFLPPAHPSLSGLSRTWVQNVLQKRVDARRNVTAGRTGSVLEVFRGTRPVSKLQFSVCGNFVCAFFEDKYHQDGTSHVAVFSSRDGTQLWQTGLSSIKESWRKPAYVFWETMQWHFDSAAVSLCVVAGSRHRRSPEDMHVHTCKLQSRSGVVMDPTSVQLSTVYGVTDQKKLGGFQLAFSHSGCLLAVAHLMRTENAARAERANTFVLDVESSVVLLSVGRTVRGLNNRLRTPLWSWDDSMLFSSGQLIHLQSSVVHLFAGPGHDNAQYGPGAFSSHDAFLGFSCDGGPRIAVSASGAEVFRLKHQNCSFISFLGALDQVLIVKRKRTSS